MSIPFRVMIQSIDEDQNNASISLVYYIVIIIKSNAKLCHEI